MGKKRDKANENIEILIDELVSERVSNLGSDCPYYSAEIKPCKCKKYDNDCNWCKEQWGEDIRERLLKQYIVN